MARMNRGVSMKSAFLAVSALCLAGVADAAWTGDDTWADEARFYSNRRAFQRGEADFGRLMSAIKSD